MRRRLRAAAFVALAVLLSGCASLRGGGAKADGADPRDPFESWNRKVFAFNEGLDDAVLKPVAGAYRAVLPEPVRLGVENFFGNLGDVWSLANHLLQGKGRSALEMGMRVGTNTVFGLGGLFDPASAAGLERQSEDFGQTLGRWGMRTGPYVVIPLLGPSTLRDSFAMTADLAMGGPQVFGEPRDRNGATVLQFVSARARLLGATKALDDAALDKYILLRDATFARRRNLVYDGDPPDDEPPPSPK